MVLCPNSFIISCGIGRAQNPRRGDDLGREEREADLVNATETEPGGGVAHALEEGEGVDLQIALRGVDEVAPGRGEHTEVDQERGGGLDLGKDEGPVQERQKSVHDPETEKEVVHEREDAPGPETESGEGHLLGTGRTEREVILGRGNKKNNSFI